MSKIDLSFITATAGLLMLSSGAFAQPPVDSGALMRQQQERENNRPPIPPSEQGPRLAPPSNSAEQAPALQAGGKIFVSEFTLSAPSTLITESEVNVLLADYTGRENSMEDLQAATEKVSAELRNRGYAFTRVLVPQQEVAEGEIALEIVPGILSSLGGVPEITVKKTGNTRISEGRASATVGNAISDPRGLNTDEIERGLLLLNDLPGVRGTGLVVPGREPGTLGIELDVREGPLFSTWIGADNFGSNATGEQRLVGDLRMNNPSGRGDAGELYLAKSEDTTSETLSYVMPIGMSGLRMRIAGSLMEYELQDEFTALNAEGNSTWFAATLSYPLLRTRSTNLSWTATLDNKRLRDFVADTQISARDAQSISGGVQGNFLLENNKHLFDYSATITRGKLDRANNATDLFVDSLTRGTQGNYAILRTTGSWLDQISPKFSLAATVEMQFADKNLDTSEKMYLGGPRGVRAYPLEEAGSDEGQTLSFEARWLAFRTPRMGGQEWTVFGLVDVGRAVRNKDTWTDWNVGNPELKNSYMLKGFGVGLRAQIGRMGQLEFVGASKIGDNPGATADGLDADGKSDDSRFWLVGSISF